MDQLTHDTGYGLISRAVMRDKNLSIQAKAIYSYLCSFANTDGESFPSRSIAASELRVNKDTYTKYLGELKEKGYLTVKQLTEKGVFKSNHYFINSYPCLKISDTVKPDTVLPDTVVSDTNNNSIKINSLKSSSNIYTPYGEIVQSFNDICSSLPKVQTITDKRKTAMRKLFKKNSIDWFKTLFTKIQASDFLTGKVKEWKADFDWIIREDHAVAICEGKYDNKEVTDSDSGSSGKPLKDILSKLPKHKFY